MNRRLAGLVFTRGGPAGNSKDALDNLCTFERIKFLAGCRRWLYLKCEILSNTTHAHRLAYQKVAERMPAP